MATPAASVRDRILDAATRRYYADGIRAVSADRLIAEAGVSKVTFYRHFPTKDDLDHGLSPATGRVVRGPPHPEAR